MKFIKFFIAVLITVASMQIAKAGTVALPAKPIPAGSRFQQPPPPPPRPPGPRFRHRRHYRHHAYYRHHARVTVHLPPPPPAPPHP